MPEILASFSRAPGLSVLPGGYLRGLLGLLLHALRFRLGLFGRETFLFGLLAALRFGDGIGASLGFALFRSQLFRGDLGLGVLLGLLLDGHHAGFLGGFHGIARSGVNQLAIALLAVGVFGCR